MAVFKRRGSGNYRTEFSYLGVAVRESTGTANKADAQAYEAKLRQEIYETRHHGRKEKMSLRAATQRYFNEVLAPTSKREAKRSYLSILGIIQAHFSTQFRHEPMLHDLTQGVVAKWRSSLLDPERPGGPLMPSTVNSYYGYLRALTNHARDEWNIEVAPVKLKWAKEGASRLRFLSDEQEAMLLDDIADHAHDIVLFLIDTGCRRGEAEHMTWRWLTEDDDGWSVNIPGDATKSRKPRCVPLPPRCAAMLARLRLASNAGLDQRVFVAGWAGRGLGTFRAAWEGVCKRIGLVDFHIHDLRHHYAYRLGHKGAMLEDLMELLGHAKIATTMRYKAWVKNDNLRRAVRLLG